MKNKKTGLLTIIIISASAFAADQQAQLSSPLAAQAIYQTGYQLCTRDNAGLTQANQAIILFTAAAMLDSRADYIAPEIIDLAWRFPQGDFNEPVRFALERYMNIGRTADLEVASRAMKYLLEKLGSREEREQFLLTLMEKYKDTNPFFVSELATQMGFLKAETADKAASQQFFMTAFSENNYNRLAFSTLAESAKTDSNGQMPAIAYLNSLRLAVRVNPLDIESAYDFSRISESLGLYAPAAAGYRYCTQVYRHLNPTGLMPAQYYRPLALNCLNMKSYRTSREVLEQVRGYGVFDVMIEAFTAMSAKNSGDAPASQAMFDEIKSKGAKILSGQVKALSGEMEDYAWYYCFVDEGNNPQDMLAWATKAYDADNNSVSAAAFMAYALVKNEQVELAKPIIEKIGTGTQTAAIAKAEILIASDDNSAAIEMLKSAVESSCGTVEATKAQAMLKRLGSEYVPSSDTSTVETSLANEYGQKFFSDFITPEKMISVSLKTPGNAFSYGSTIDTQLVITNNSSEPMIVSPEGIFKGNVQVDIRLSGDLNERIEKFMFKTVRPSYEIRPGSALFVPLQLSSGKLKTILDGYPQANLNVEVTVYLDPQSTADGKLQSIFGTDPIKAVLKRRNLELDTFYLQQRFDSLKNGRQGQKIKSTQLFAGLLSEQQKLAKTEKRYKFVYCEPGLLTSAMAKCLNEDDWVLKIETMSALYNVTPDYRLVNAISEQLDYSEWPVRLMALCIISDKQGGDNFASVLKWASTNDTDPLVKSMAAVLSGEK